MPDNVKKFLNFPTQILVISDVLSGQNLSIVIHIFSNYFDGLLNNNLNDAFFPLLKICYY